MGKTKVSRHVTAGDINCLENLVVAYNTVFLMSSVFIIVIAWTTKGIISDVVSLSPSLVLFAVACFIVFLAIIGYVGVGKKSSSLLSLYTMLLIFVFVMEISSGFAVLSFRNKIHSSVFSKMKKAMAAYPSDPMTANLVDYVQLELGCCGATSFKNWEDIFEPTYQTNCKISDISLPPSCCKGNMNSTSPVVNKRGCLPTVNFMLHKSLLSVTTALIAICTIQMLGAYFSYSLASSLSKYKIQRAENSEALPPRYEAGIPIHYNEKIGHF